MSTEPERVEIEPMNPQLYVFFAIFFTISLWIWWAVEHFTGLRLTELGRPSTRGPLSIWLPAAGTPAILIGTYLRWQRAVGITENGLPVEAKIVKFGGGAHGMRDVTLSYPCNGTIFKKKTTLDEDELRTKGVGGIVPIIVDARNPKRFILNRRTARRDLRNAK